MANLYQQKSRWASKLPMLPPLICLISGIWLQSLVSLTGIVWVSLLLLSIAGFTLLHYLKTINGAIYKLRHITYVCCFLLLGSTVTYFEDIRNHTTWYGHYVETAEAFAIKIIEDPELKSKTHYLPSEVQQVLVNGRWQKVKGCVLLYVYRKDSDQQFQKGQKLIISNKFVRIQNSGNPYAFEYATYCARKQLYHQAFVQPEDILIYSYTGKSKDFLNNTRRSLMHSIQRNVPDSNTRSLIEATLLNERASLNDDLWQAYSITGIVHIIAISGMHVALLFTILLFLMSWLKDKKADWIKYFAAIPLVWFYIAITGYPPSAVRAAVMFTLLAIGIKLNRSGHPVNTWAITAFILLLFHPSWLYDIGVQLSFLSVLSILLFFQPIRRWIAPHYVMTRYIWNTVAVCIAAQVLVFPLVLYYFHQFPLLSIIANIPAAVYSFLLMTGSLLLFLLDSLGIPCVWLGHSLTIITDYFHHIITMLAQNTPRAMQQLFIEHTGFWLIMGSIGLLSLFLFRKKSLYLFSGGGCIICLLLLIIYRDWQQQKQKCIIVYNSPGLSAIDIFRGKSVQVYSPEQEKITRKDFQYYQLPARLGYGATVKYKDTLVAPIWKAGDAVILYLDGHVADIASPFPVQFLIVNNQSKFNPELWNRIFMPDMVILDGSLPRWKALKWRQQLEQMGIRVHWVGDNGAWVYKAEDS